MQNSENLVETYLTQLADVLRTLPREPLQAIISTLRQARVDRKKIFICGNGGSAATASHMVCDFIKNTRDPARPHMRVIGLNDNMPTLSAYANDEGYETVFAEPLRSLGEAGDVAIAISGSGNSPNVLETMRAARECGLKTIGLTGFAGGKIKDMVDICLIVPSDRIEQVEDLHMIIDHLVTLSLKE
jgi:D-sedoheptulose 7-phosphate isomerase